MERCALPPCLPASLETIVIAVDSAAKPVSSVHPALISLPSGFYMVGGTKGGEGPGDGLQPTTCPGISKLHLISTRPGRSAISYILGGRGGTCLMQEVGCRESAS